jgi:hypothetical protein
MAEVTEEPVVILLANGSGRESLTGLPGSARQKESAEQLWGQLKALDELVFGASKAAFEAVTGAVLENIQNAKNSGGLTEAACDVGNNHIQEQLKFVQEQRDLYYSFAPEPEISRVEPVASLPVSGLDRESLAHLQGNEFQKENAKELQDRLQMLGDVAFIAPEDFEGAARAIREGMESAKHSGGLTDEAYQVGNKQIQEQLKFVEEQRDLYRSLAPQSERVQEPGVRPENDSQLRAHASQESDVTRPLNADRMSQHLAGFKKAMNDILELDLTTLKPSVNLTRDLPKIEKDLNRHLRAVEKEHKTLLEMAHRITKKEINRLIKDSKRGQFVPNDKVVQSDRLYLQSGIVDLPNGKRGYWANVAINGEKQDVLMKKMSAVTKQEASPSLNVVSSPIRKLLKSRAM